MVLEAVICITDVRICLGYDSDEDVYRPIMADLVRDLDLRYPALYRRRGELFRTRITVPEHPKQYLNISERLGNNLTWYRGQWLIVVSSPHISQVPYTLTGPPLHLKAPPNDALFGPESIVYVAALMVHRFRAAPILQDKYCAHQKG